MDKPVSMTIKECRDNIVSVINGSNLHPEILCMIFKDLYTELQALATKQAAQEAQQWEDAQKSEASEKK